MNEFLSQQKTLLKVVILFLIALVAFSSRLFSVIRFESIIHEFDPWFNFRSTQYLVKRGFYDFINWFDEYSWYPLGRAAGGTLYPGLMVTSASIYSVLRKLNIPIDIREICVFLAPLFSGLTALSTYLMTKELKDDRSGLLAAAFIGITPGYISRSVAGSYDNEAVAIFAMMFTFYMWIKAVKLGSAFWAVCTALGYFYMVSSWGGYVFIINVIPLHVFVLLLMGRYSGRIYVSYCTFYVIGTILSMLIPFVGFQPVRNNDHMAALGIFGLLQLVAFTDYLRGKLQAVQIRYLLTVMTVAIGLIAFGGLVILTSLGFIAPWTGRFYSLFDPEYAKTHLPIISSVSEHQPTTWTSFFFDMQSLIFLFPLGLYFCFRELADEHVFLIIYALTASYFAGVMVRLILTLAPGVCVGAAIGLSYVIDTFLKVPSTTLISPTKSEKKKSHQAIEALIRDKHLRLVVIGPLLMLMVIYQLHCTFVTSYAYSSPSVVLASTAPDGTYHIIDDFREAYYWLRKNTSPDAKIMSWWDYGYQIAGFSNRTTLVDNNTWNNTHIATVGRAMASTEEDAYELMRKLDVDYVLVIFGGLSGFSGDDINKFLWMVRIGQGVYPDHIKESDYFTKNGDYRVNNEASQTMLNSLMYKLSYYRFHEVQGTDVAFDRVRGTQIGLSKFHLNYVEEAFTSEHWIVRVYKVKKPDVFGRDLKQASHYDRIAKKKINSGHSKSVHADLPRAPQLYSVSF